MLRPWCWLRHQSLVGVQGPLCVLGVGIPSLSHECLGGPWLTDSRSRHQSPVTCGCPWYICVHGAGYSSHGCYPWVSCSGYASYVSYTHSQRCTACKWLLAVTCKCLLAVPVSWRAQVRCEAIVIGTKVVVCKHNWGGSDLGGEVPFILRHD